MTEKRVRRMLSEEQKKQFVELFNHGKHRSRIIRNYGLTALAFDELLLLLYSYKKISCS